MLVHGPGEIPVLRQPETPEEIESQKFRDARIAFEGRLRWISSIIDEGDLERAERMVKYDFNCLKGPRITLLDRYRNPAIEENIPQLLGLLERIQTERVLPSSTRLGQ